jgi:coatomer subunit beta'
MHRVLIIGWENTVYIWNWQTNERIGEYKRRISYTDGNSTVAQFIARKHWAVIGKTDGSILVLMCPKMDPLKEINAHREGVTSLGVHRTRPLLLSASSMSVKLWDWNRGWSCTGMFEVTTPVRQVMFNPKNATTFVSFHEDGKIMVCLTARPTFL